MRGRRRPLFAALLPFIVLLLVHHRAVVLSTGVRRATENASTMYDWETSSDFVPEGGLPVRMKKAKIQELGHARIVTKDRKFTIRR
jgi:hypothetical protein